MYGATPLVHEPPAKRRIMVAPLALAAVSMTIFWAASTQQRAAPTALAVTPEDRPAWNKLTPEERWDYRCADQPVDTGCEACGVAEGTKYYDALAAQYPAVAAACHTSHSGDPENPVPTTHLLPNLGWTYDDGSPMVEGNSWFKVCQWRALAELPAFCAGGWAPAPPTSPGPPATTPDEYHCDCERHAYCSSGLRGNAYVDAYIAKHPYVDDFAWRTPGHERAAGEDAVGDDLLWKEQAYWCSSDVLGAIADGTYRPE